MNQVREKIKRHICLNLIRYIKFERSYLANKNEKTILKFLMRGIVAIFVLIVILLSIMLLVMIVPFIDLIFMYLTGAESKLEIIKLIGWGTSGLIAVLVVFGLLLRAAALEAQNNIMEKGNFHIRFKTATEHLSSEQSSLRIAAFNEFYHIAEIEPDLRNTIFNILFAHLKQTIKDEDYKKSQIQPTNEVQNLLDILFKPHKDILIFGGTNLNLEEVNLRGADLEGVNLRCVNLYKASMEKANLKEAKLENANLQGANLQKANLLDVELLGANLMGTELQEADMHLAGLCRAEMFAAKLQGAIMQNAYLQKANLQFANLQGADLSGAIINKETKMPDNWENIVKRDKDGETGVIEED